MTSFDLHVLGMPPAFILSQDQTLHLLIFFLTLARLVSLFALLIPYSELTFPVQFSKIDFLASRLLRSALVYITILSLFRQAFFLLFFEENDMVPEAGLEPARYRYRRILSPLRLPVSPLGHATLLYINRRTIAIKNVISVQKKSGTAAHCPPDPIMPSISSCVIFSSLTIASSTTSCLARAFSI